MVAIKEKPEKVFAKQGLANTVLRMSVALNILQLDFKIEAHGAGIKKSAFRSAP